MPHNRKQVNIPKGKARHAQQRALAIPYGSKTDVGLVREHNEDSLIVKPPLFLVADGMGGHQAGEVASEIAAQVVAQKAPLVANGDELARATIAANRAIIQAAHEGHGREGMGTTLTAAIVEGERIVVSQVGDSRAYLLHQKTLQRVTRDHSLMTELIECGQITEEEARTHPQRSIITRALGSDPSTLPDIYEMNVSAGDRLLLCSDGLSGMVHDRRLEAILSEIKDPQQCANALIEEALANGGSDNVTAIVVDIVGNAPAVVKKEKRHGRFAALIFVLLLTAVLAGGVFGLHSYAHNSAYIALEDNQIIIYQGVPGSFMGFSVSEQIEICDISTSEVPAGVMNSLKNGELTVSNLDEAYELVDTWKSQAEEDKAREYEGQSPNTPSGDSASSGGDAS